MLKNIAICIVFIILQVIYLCHSNTQPDYGAFTYKVSNIAICKGPKRIDCSNNTLKLENGKTLLLNMDIQRNVVPNRGKITISINGHLLLRLQMKKPCDHVFFKPLTQKYFNATEECEFKKGLYKLNVDVEKMAQEFYGGMFFYGELSFKTVLQNDNCNFICILIESIISPKKSS